MIPITNAVFSAASEEIRSLFLESGVRWVDLGGSGWNISGSSVLVVVDVVIIPRVVLTLVLDIVVVVVVVLLLLLLLLPRDVTSGEVRSGNSDAVITVLKPRWPASGVVLPIVLGPT